jgi:hypothetical protein
MANTRLSMRKIKEVLRLSFQCGLSARQVALSTNISRSTVKDYLVRAERAGIGWPVAESLTDEQIEQRLFAAKILDGGVPKPLPDFEYIYHELKSHKKFNLTLDLLWQEYKEQHPEGYQYSQYCELYRRYRAKLDYSMRQDHRGGEKLFVDYGEGLKLFRSPKWRGGLDRALCRCLGRFQLHLRRSDPEPATARLDRLPYQSLLLLWLCAQDRGA